jgi:hypothetical protein
MKDRDWSLNLEDTFYENNPEEIIKESVEAIQQTSEGCYVNLVTPGKCGDPRDGFIAQLGDRLRIEGLAVKAIQFVDQCGCGGYVTRVFR